MVDRPTQASWLSIFPSYQLQMVANIYYICCKIGLSIRTAIKGWIIVPSGLENKALEVEMIYTVSTKKHNLFCLGATPQDTKGLFPCLGVTLGDVWGSHVVWVILSRWLHTRHNQNTLHASNACCAIFREVMKRTEI